MEPLLADERFNSFEKLVANLDEFKALVSVAYLEYTTDEVIERLKKADVPCARCLSKDEVLEQDQVVANDTVEVIDHPLMGKMRVVKSPARFGGERLSPSRPSPDHGEHTREVLAEFLVPEDRIDQLAEHGVVS
jgi:crotonobetainyl-CoA:carnitine CoA-transferase CaiB-like acyl-CoA transferase